VSQAPLDILKQYWGYDSFRPLQEDIIQSVLDNRDTLALLPTGGGKSICFQVPALAQEGICIVVSPLIALMKDQVENLRKRRILAEAIYSGMRRKDIDRILDNCIYGKTKFLYLSPERLTTELARERIARMPVNMLAVDEAHCISQWGYDFRPPYLEIANIRDLLPKGTPTLALTATATPEVVKDIQEKLEFKQPNVLQKSFARPNLSYSVLYEEGKDKKLVDVFRRVKGSGIVYVRNRRKTKEIARLLQRHRIPADYYHAGLPTEERTKRQEAWMSGKCRVMACTNAFGMGIDKPDVRVVAHVELPDSLEAYFQEAGRAGRDGEKAYAVMLYEQEDGQRLLRQFEQAYPPMAEVRRVYRALGSYFQLAVGSGEGQSFDFDIVAFTNNFQLDLFRTYSALRILEQAGWVVLTDAVFVPSTLRIIVNKDTLYDYQLRHAKMDKLLKAILRTYQGAFTYPIKIREGQLAHFLKMPRAQLIKMLRKLHQDQIVDYQEQKDTPQLLFLRERVDADNLTIDHQLHNFRKNRQYERIQKAIAYAETPVCRSQQLLAYFGETDAEKCGICDVCTGRTKTEMTKADFQKYRDKIEQLLRQEKLSVEQLVDSFPPKRQEQVLKALEFLLDEGYIDKTEEQLHWNA
jgi:ATP-dependent DNA helicase RecQ